MNQSPEANIDNSQISSNINLGELFKQTRLKQNISLDDVCQQINLRPSLLTQLENNDFTSANIPVTFMKGYIRSYAKFLQLPESCYADVFNSLSDFHKNDLGKNTRIMKHVNHHSAHNHRIGYFSLLVILILVIVTGLWWWQNYQQTESDRNNLVENYVEQPLNQNLPNNLMPATNKESQTTPKTIEQPVEPASNIDSQNKNLVTPMTDLKKNNAQELIDNKTSSDQQPLTSGAILEQAMLDAKADNGEQKLANEESQKNIVNDAVLQIKVKGDCWLSVKDSKNKVLAQKLYKAGKTLDFYNKSPYSLVIGSPKNVEIIYKGKPYSLNINGKVAKVKLS